MLEIDSTYDKPLEHLLANFETQLKNNKTLSSKKVEGYLAFNKFTKSLYRLRKNPENFHTKLLELKTRINLETNLVLKHWIKQKLEELLPSSSNTS